MLQPGADPVRKISIIPRGRALGVTLSTPDTDRYAYDEQYLRGRIVGALGGMAAEQVVYGVITTGSENDLEQVTMIARGMVGRWGMSSSIGPLTILPSPGQEQFDAELLVVRPRRDAERFPTLLRQRRWRCSSDVCHRGCQSQRLATVSRPRTAGVNDQRGGATRPSIRS